jgi:hypothetical protein
MAQRWRGGGGGWHGGYHGGGGWGGYRGYRGNRTGVALGAGLLGLGIGAAIASSNRGPYYGGYGGYYGPPRYRGGYGYYGGYYRDCVVREQWDPYVGDYVPVRSCY